MDCAACEARLGDLRDGTLGPVIAGEVRQHLERCAACRDLEATLATVAAVLEEAGPSCDPTPGLAGRLADATWPRRARWLALWPLAPERGGPPWRVQAAAAAASLVMTGVFSVGASAWTDPRSHPARALQSVNAAAGDLRALSDRWAEDIRLVRMLVSTAFEGRIDRLQAQVEDYRQILEKRRQKDATASPPPIEPAGSDSRKKL